MAGETVLIVDDEAETRKIISLLLKSEGYLVETADSHEAAMRSFKSGRIDLVLLDVLMPGIDGWETCEELRRESDVPIMLVSALDHPMDMVRGLRSGADDFYVKPVQRDLLLARIEALLRRSHFRQEQFNNPKGDRIYDDGYLHIELALRRVHVEDELISMTPTELALLGYLLRNSGQVVTYRQILEEIWNWDDSSRIGYVHTYVSRLRSKLEPDPAQPIYITNEYGFGYRFNEQQNSSTESGLDNAQSTE